MGGAAEAFVVAPADPREDAVRELIDTHYAFGHAFTPPEDAHALGVEELLDPTLTLFVCRVGDEILGVGALKEIDPEHGELKSMHTAEQARRRGVGQAMLDHLLAEARRRGYLRLSLETGAMEAFAPARELYLSAGFRPCAPFGEYSDSHNIVCMSLDLGN